MTATTGRATGGGPNALSGRSPAQSPLQGLREMVLFLARRNWLRLLVWVVVLVGMIPFVYESQRAAFPTAADREAYASIANTPSVAALTGTAYAANTLGGILVLKIWMTLALTLAFVTVFLVTRNGRADEESGRTELLRANVVGRHAYTLANYLVVGAFNVVAGLGIAGTAMALTLPVMGSLVLGASLTGVGLFFLGVAAIGSQMSSSGRGANSFAATVIGIAYVLRSIGDLNGTVTKPGWISWLSPIGWGQEMRAFGLNRWWPLMFLVVGAILLCWVSVKVEARRDLGFGVLPDRLGPLAARRFLLSPFGLAVRLQRSTIVGWFIAMVVMALLYGSVASAMVDLLGTNPVFSKVFEGQGQSITNSVVGLLVMLNAIVASAFVVESALQLRVEESSGRAEPQLAGSVSRLRWAGERLLVPVLGSFLMLIVGGAVLGAAYGASQADPSQLGVLLGASITYWPGVLLTAGVCVLLIAFVPREAAAFSWAYFSLIVIISVFGDLFSLPPQIINNTPLTATPRLPAETLSAVPLLILAGIALLLWAIGLLRYTRRDLVQGA